MRLFKVKLNMTMFLSHVSLTPGQCDETWQFPPRRTGKSNTVHISQESDSCISRTGSM